ncbi:MAG TPA: hypothetical protein VHP62_08645, partial [Usitatibacter sp.]|nr:hypothetical protein [Usitatibacter sp.]
MTLRNLSIRTRLTALLMFVNTLLVVATGYAWYAIATMNNRIHDMDVTQNHVEEAGDLARQAQLHFKVQVQEWKNMLLRGHDLKLLDKHTKAFEEETAKVASTLKALNAVAPKIEMPATLADAAVLEHEDLARRYTDAFKAFRSVEEGTSRDV